MSVQIRNAPWRNTETTAHCRAFRRNRPRVEQLTYTLTDIDDEGMLSVMTEAGEMREDLNLPGEDSTDPELANKIQAAFDTADDNDLEVLVIVTKCKANKADADPIEKVTAFKTQPME